MSERQRVDGKPIPANQIALVQAALGITPQQLRQKTRNDKRTISARELRALDLLIAGANYGQIAQVLNLKTRAGAIQLVQRALAKRAAEAAEVTVPEARALYLDRLDKLFTRWFPLALGSAKDNIPPDPMAAKLVLDMMTRYAKVTGIESPVKIEETVDVTIHDPDAQRERVLKSLQSFAKRGSGVIEGTAVETPTDNAA